VKPWDVTAADILWMEVQHKALRILTGELHDAGTDEDALVKCDGLVAIANEWRALVQRRAVERAERMSEHPQEALPPVEVGTWGRS
jgi:hypothetical protein